VFLAQRHEHEAPVADVAERQAGGTLSGIAEAFGGRTTITSADLLPDRAAPHREAEPPAKAGGCYYSHQRDQQRSRY